MIIDARVCTEYEHEHIAGALSLPGEVLRRKYRDLDLKKSYITYCTNNAHGKKDAG